MKYCCLGEYLLREDTEDLMFNDNGSECLGEGCEGSAVSSFDGRTVSSGNGGAIDTFSIKLPAGVFFV